MTKAHIKPDDIEAPLDIRLVPAALMTALICYIVPKLSTSQSALVFLGLLFCGIASIAISRIYQQSPKLSQHILLLAIACWIATPVAIQTWQHNNMAEVSGWTRLVQEQGTTRLSVEVSADSIERNSTFGTTWYVAAEVETIGNSHTPTPHPAKIMISSNTSLREVKTGDRLCFIGQIQQTDTSIFVRAMTNISSGSCQKDHQESGVTGRETIREALRTQAAETVGYAPQLLPGLILGDRTSQSESLDEAMKISGLSHLSAVSGAHTSLIAAAATILFRSLGLSRPVVVGAFLCTLLLYVVIVGAQPSVIRAATMGAIGAWAVFFGRGSQILPTLALSTIIILTISPELIYDVGFQLSVLATAGIVIGAQPLEERVRPLFKRFLPDFWARMLSSAFSMSLAAQIACQPLLLTFVDYVSLYSLLANLFATPLLPFITVPGTLAAGLSTIAPTVSQLVLQVIAVPTTVIGWIATTTTELPGAMVLWPEGPVGYVLLILYCLSSWFILVTLLRHQRKSKPPIKIDSPAHSWKVFGLFQQNLTNWQYLKVIVVVTTFVAHLAVLLPHSKPSLPQDWHIIGCDVGQGDMFLVRTGAASAIVIDTGPDPSLAKQCIKQAHIEHLDLLVITHLHEDHVGGIEGVLENIPVDQIIYSTGTEQSKALGSDKAIARGTQVRTNQSGLIVYTAKDDEQPMTLRWTVLNANSETSNENNASIVLLLEMTRNGKQFSAVFTGDLEDDEATKLLNANVIPPNIDFLKLSHHGAKNGGTGIIEQTKPEVVLIGVAAENLYGHPHKDILDAIPQEVLVKRTDIHGTFSLSVE